MVAPAQSMMRNRLLALLPGADYDEIARTLEFVALPRGTKICETGQIIDHVYFLTNGVGAVIAVTKEGHSAEAGIFGPEGYIPTSAAADTEVSSFDVSIQIDAEGYRMDYSTFRTCMENHRSFSKVMIRCIEAFSIQLAYTAVSNAVHDVTERLARWLLMCHDRLEKDELALTHDFLSLMLAVRRPSVTNSLHLLEGNRFIRAQRGMIIIRNRKALEEFAQDAYGKPEQEYRRLMTGLF